MPNISCFLTQRQVRDGSKDVTRRLGKSWLKIQPGRIVTIIVKGQGLKKGEKVQRIRDARIVKVNPEPLCAIRYYRTLPDGRTEMAREGFPELSADEFICMFMKHMDCSPEEMLARIEWEYVGGFYPVNKTVNSQ